MNELKVKIPSEFEEQLRKRFSLENFVDGVNNTPCPLCEKYYGDNCRGCPFDKFRRLNTVGCEIWENTLVGCEIWENTLVGRHFGGTGMIILDKKDRSIFSELVEKAKELVEFV